MNECFIYGLYDPNTNEIFYVGKGTEYRDRSHLKPSMWKDPKKTCNPFLYYKIKSLMENNTPPIIKRLYENLLEEEAYRIEAEIIKEHGRRFSPENGKLFNISEWVGGNKKGIEMPWSEERKQRHREYCKSKRIYDPTYEELYDDFITNNLKRKDIAEKYGVSDALIKQRLRYFGIKKPKHLQYGKQPTHICEVCNNSFETSPSVKRKFCSKECFHEHRKRC